MKRRKHRTARMDASPRPKRQAQIKKSLHRILHEEWQWKMERSTICRYCDRRTLTTHDRVCFRCWKRARQNVIDFIVGWLS